LISALARRAKDLGIAVQFGSAVDAAGLDAALVIAADGVKSAHRSRLNPSDPAFFTGQVAWRAVVEGQGPAEAQVFMAPGRHLVSYPLIGGRRNIVAVEERTEWVEEDWDLADDPASLRSAFRGIADEAQGWLDQVQTVKLWGLFRHPVARMWQDGRCVLIGDAAHPTLPFLAQGANLALEDALVLARCLAQIPDQTPALAAFQSARDARVRRAIRAANGNARAYHLSTPALRRLTHLGLRLADRMAPGLMLRRFDWLYRFDPTA